MAKLYTLDNKLLTGAPEVRIKDKVYPVDDRKRTVSKILAVSQEKDKSEDEMINEVFELAFGKKAKEVIKFAEDMPWAAYQELFSLVLAAVTGQEPKSEEDNTEDNVSSGS